MPAVLTSWLIYGAYGYTAELIIEEAVRRGHQPIIAGRDEEKVLAIAEKYALHYRVFDLSHKQKVRQAIRDVGLVLNCAGPFVETATLMRAACLDEAVHYLDITGEIDVLEDSYACHEQARKQGVVVISGVGFDVVATDVVAVLLKEALPSATRLELAFAGEGGVSPGTAKTLLRMLPQKGKIRQNGDIVNVPLGFAGKTMRFSDQARYCVSIPWGDISTAFHSTSIANIVVYTAMDQSQQRWLKRINPFIGVLAWPPLQRYLNRYITRKITGPDQMTRQSAMMQVMGIAQDDVYSVEGRLRTPEGYSFTVLTALYTVESILAHKIMPGAYTPSQALDIDAILSMEGVEWQQDDIIKHIE